MKKPSLFPTFVSSLRISSLPLFFILFTQDNVIACLGLLAFCAATDFFDGYLARKFKETSRFGAYYDATTDFILMIGIFTIFYASGFYPIWVLLLIVASFAQFLATSRYFKKLYDPVGRYFGSALYIGVVLTLLWPTELVFAFVKYALIGFFLVSIASRIISLTRKRT